MQDYLVSVCLPTYNRPVTLERTLNSLINQTYSNLEIIISDNCSTNPEVLNTINKFKSDNRIKYFRQDTNRGPIFNFNFVTTKVSGSFFMLVGDDDWLDNNYIESCIHLLLLNSDYAAAYGAAKIFTKSGAFYGNDVQTDMTVDNAGERVKNYLRDVRHNGTYYALIRREYLSLIELRNIIAIDWLVVSRVAFAGKIKLLDTTQLNLSLGGDSSSIANMTSAYGMSYFTKKYPYLSICFNVFFDIFYRSPGYKTLGLTKRYKLAYQCYKIVYHKHKHFIKKELSLKNKGLRRVFKFRTKIISGVPL